MNLVIREMRPEDTDAVRALVEAVHEAMPEEQKIWLNIDGLDEAMEGLRNGTMKGWVAEDTEQDVPVLAGAFYVEIPGLREDNLGRHIGFCDAQLLQVAHMDTTVVHPAYRGQGLQRKLGNRGMEYLEKKGMRYLMATIHPDNLYSMNNALKGGYRPVWRGEKYGGKLRDVVLKEINLG